MDRIFRIAAIVASFLALSAIPAGAASDLPDVAAPAGGRAVDGPRGGRIIDAPLVGVHSPEEALRAGLRTAGRYFGRPPQLVSVVRSTDGSLTLGLFRDSVRTQPVAGLLFAVYGTQGGSRVAAVFDRPARLSASLKPLLTRLYAMAPQSVNAASGSDRVTLEPHIAPDKSVGISTPPGWKIPIFAQGVAVVTGPGGEEIDKQLAINLLDPRGSFYQNALALAQSSHIRPQLTGMPLQYVADAGRAYVAVLNMLAQERGQPAPDVRIERSTPQHDPYVSSGSSVDAVVGTLTVHGVRNRFVGNVLSTPPNANGAWMVSANLVSAPDARFKAEFPILSAINDSYTIDQRVRGQQVHETIVANAAGSARNAAIAAQTQARNAAVFNASMGHARDVQDSIDRSTAGFTRYLSDTDVVGLRNGAHATVDSNFAATIVHSDPSAFRIVPVSEYRAGIDY